MGGFLIIPTLNDRKTKTLEIPSYFLCDASLEQINSPESLKLLKDYYLNLIQENINNGKPIAIMGHPHLIGRLADIFYPSIFQQIKKLKIPVSTIGEFVYWWRKRENISIKIFYKKSDNQLEISSNTSGFLIQSIFRKRRHLFKIDKGKVKKLLLDKKQGKIWQNEITVS